MRGNAGRRCASIIETASSVSIAVFTVAISCISDCSTRVRMVNFSRLQHTDLDRDGLSGSPGLVRYHVVEDFCKRRCPINPVRIISIDWLSDIARHPCRCDIRGGVKVALVVSLTCVSTTNWYWCDMLPFHMSAGYAPVGAATAAVHEGNVQSGRKERICISC